MPAAETRNEKLDLRLTPSAKRTLQTAALAARRSVSEFVLGSALARAEETLPDRQRFGLNAEPEGACPRPHATRRGNVAVGDCAGRCVNYR